MTHEICRVVYHGFVALRMSVKTSEHANVDENTRVSKDVGFENRVPFYASRKRDNKWGENGHRCLR